MSKQIHASLKGDKSAGKDSALTQQGILAMSSHSSLQVHILLLFLLALIDGKRAQNYSIFSCFYTGVAVYSSRWANSTSTSALWYRRVAFL